MTGTGASGDIRAAVPTTSTSSSTSPTTTRGRRSDVDENAGGHHDAASFATPARSTPR